MRLLNPLPAFSRLGVTAGLLSSLLVVAPATAQHTSEVVGRVLNLEQNLPIHGAVVQFDSTRFRAATNERGNFRFPEVPEGIYVLRVEHVGYESQADTVHISGPGTVAIRLTLSTRAIELAPIVVSVMGNEELNERARGTRINVIDRDEIEEKLRGGSVGRLVAEKVPGATFRTPGGRPGGQMCLEFRSPASVAAVARCKFPLVILDGVRVSEPGPALSMMNLENLERIEVVPPSEAGAQYGTGSGWGVIKITTRRGPQPIAAERSLLNPETILEDSSYYPWEAVHESHPWGRSYLGGLLGNALGLAGGTFLARQCLDILNPTGETYRNNECGTLPTVGIHAAAWTLPIIGAALGTRIGGTTEMSRGRFLPSAFASAATMIPSFVVLTSGSGTNDLVRWAGFGMMIFAVPAASSLTDRLFRTLRDD